jgi:NTE family protein
MGSLVRYAGVGGAGSFGYVLCNMRREAHMERTRIAIACQGGGSQCAFVAGALKRLFAESVDERFRIVGLSGTSGGALTAAVAWQGLLARAQGDRTPIEDRIGAFWNDLSAQTPLELALDAAGVQLVRLVEQGLLPSLASSPSSLGFRFWSLLVSGWIGRPEFTDLRALIEKHLNFAALASLIRPDSPALLVGACDVLEGSFKTFSSALGEINVESLLASAAIPNLFPAVSVDGHAYWDGIFSSNPPVADLLRYKWMGQSPLPEEVWIVQVNRSRHELIPERPGDIFNRRNHLAGNLSLLHELRLIEVLNMLIQENLLTDEVRVRFGLDMTQTITLRFIRMSQQLEESLDYPSKLSRQPLHINGLIADGEAQAAAFLEHLSERPAAEPPCEEAIQDASMGIL